MTTIETVYWACGVAVIWLSGLTVTAFIIQYLFTKILNLLGNIYDPLWKVIDYLKNKEEFEEWKKEDVSKRKLLIEYCNFIFDECSESDEKMIDDFLKQNNRH